MRALLCPLFVVTSLWLSTALSMESYKVEDGYEVFPAYNQSRYKLSTIFLPWVQALSLCQGDGGGSLLAVINSDLEAEVIKELVARVNGTGYTGAWMGIDDIAQEGNWVTVQGGIVATSGYNKWLDDEPSGGTAQNCGLVWFGALYGDYYCTSTVPFICEKPNV